MLKEHPWIKGQASDKPIDSAVLSRMKQFRAMNKLKKLALKVILFMTFVFGIIMQFLEAHFVIWSASQVLQTSALSVRFLFLFSRSQVRKNLYCSGIHSLGYLTGPNHRIDKSK